jgi:hypothetical protein
MDLAVYRRWKWLKFGVGSVSEFWRWIWLCRQLKTQKVSGRLASLGTVIVALDSFDKSQSFELFEMVVQ